MNFEVTRLENDERLLPQIETIRTSESIGVLVPFAKAYLGMFYVIESELPAKDKVRLLANEELAAAVFQGFIASLTRAEIPAVEDIGFAMAEQKELAEGYVMLAGIDLLTSNSMNELEQLPEKTIGSLIGFHFSNKTNHKNNWFDILLQQQKSLVASTVSKYWTSMLKNNAVYLPGIDLILGEKPDELVVEKCVLHVLQNWKHCKEKRLLKLLLLAFNYSKPEDLLQVAASVLEDDESLTEKSRLFWIATAYFIAPEKYYARLFDYVGRVKIKIMPLLDFITQAMANKNSKLSFDDRLIAELIRHIAPVFPPQHHVYGSLGGLDINSKNVMLLFYALMCSESKVAQHELKALRKVRVMKIYSGVIDYLLEQQLRKKNDATFVFPGFEVFLASLFDNDLLQGKSNRFDLH